MMIENIYSVEKKPTLLFLFPPKALKKCSLVHVTHSVWSGSKSKVWLFSVALGSIMIIWSFSSSWFRLWGRGERGSLWPPPSAVRLHTIQSVGHIFLRPYLLFQWVPTLLRGSHSTFCPWYLWRTPICPQRVKQPLGGSLGNGYQEGYWDQHYNDFFSNLNRSLCLWSI